MDEVGEDLVVTNVDCPPPLFYNSRYEPERDEGVYGPSEARKGPYQSFSSSWTSVGYNETSRRRNDSVPRIGIRIVDIHEGGFSQRKVIRKAR